MAEYLYTFYLLLVEREGKYYHYGKKDTVIDMVTGDATVQVKRYGYAHKKDAREARSRLLRIYPNVSIVEAVVTYDNYEEFSRVGVEPTVGLPKMREDIVKEGKCFSIMKIK